MAMHHHTWPGGSGSNKDSAWLWVATDCVLIGIQSPCSAPQLLRDFLKILTLMRLLYGYSVVTHTDILCTASAKSNHSGKNKIKSVDLVQGLVRRESLSS